MSETKTNSTTTKFEGAHRQPDKISELEAEIERLTETLTAWKAKLNQPQTEIQWFSENSGEWLPENLHVRYWGVEIMRRIKPEADDD